MLKNFFFKIQDKFGVVLTLPEHMRSPRFLVGFVLLDL